MSADAPSVTLLEPYDIIFSCSVCFRTVSDAYNAAAKTTEALTGTSTVAGHGPIRLWLTDCGHVSCATHLEGGGEVDPAALLS